MLNYNFIIIFYFLIYRQGNYSIFNWNLYFVRLSYDLDFLCSYQEKQRAKVKEKLDKCVKEKLTDFCVLLDIPINKTSIKKVKYDVMICCVICLIYHLQPKISLQATIIGRSHCEVIGVFGIPTCYNWCFAYWEGSGLMIFSLCLFSRWSSSACLVVFWALIFHCLTEFQKSQKRKKKVAPRKSAGSGEASPETPAKVWLA